MPNSFHRNFSEFKYAMEYWLAPVELDAAYSLARTIRCVTELMDDSVRAKLYEPTEEQIAAYHREMQAFVERQAYGQFPFDPRFEPASPFTPKEQQLLPEPIWTNIALLPDGMLVLTRVYGGVLRPDFHEDQTSLEAQDGPDRASSSLLLSGAEPSNGRLSDAPHLG